MSRNNELQRIVSRLNQLRISRRDIAREEEALFRELREYTREPTIAPLQVVSSEETELYQREPLVEETARATLVKEEEVEEDGVKVEAESEEFYPTGAIKEEEKSVGEPRPPALGIIKRSGKLERGTRVFISNNISHYREREGTSYHHRLATVEEHNTRTGRVDIVTDSGHHLWRKKKNLNLVIEE